MQKHILVTAVVLVAMSAGLTVGLAIEALAPLASKPPPPRVTISIADIHRQADVKSLPVLEIREPF